LQSWNHFSACWRNNRGVVIKDFCQIPIPFRGLFVLRWHISPST